MVSRSNWVSLENRSPITLASSANKKRGDFIAIVKLFTNTRNSSGPNTEPWETPLHAFASEDFTSSTTWKLRLVE